MKLSNCKTLRVLMAFVLALGLMPLPAYAANSNDLVAGSAPSLSTQDSGQSETEVGEVEQTQQYDISGCEVDYSSFVRYGSDNMSPVASVSLNGNDLVLGQDYELQFFESDEYKSMNSDIEGVPSELGYYGFYVNGLNDYYGSFPLYYSVVPEDYAGEITKECVTIDGLTWQEFVDQTHYADGSRLEPDVQVVVNGQELTAGKDYELVFNDGSVVYDGENSMVLKDLRIWTTFAGKEGIYDTIYCESAINLSKCRPIGEFSFEYRDGSEIYIDRLRVLSDDNARHYLSLDYQVDVVFTDASGQEYSRPSEIGTYQMTITPKENARDYGYTTCIGSATFTAEVKEGIDLSKLDWELEVPQLDNVFYHEGGVEIGDIDSISIPNYDRTMHKGTDYTYRIVSGFTDAEEAVIDGPGSYYLEVTGQGEYFGVAYKQFEVKDPTYLSNAVVDFDSYVKAGSERMAPVKSVTLDGATLEEGVDYTVIYYETDESGNDATSLDSLPTEPGYYAFHINEVSDPTSYYGSSNYYYYSIVAADYAGAITRDAITIDGASIDEFKNASHYKSNLEFDFDIDVNVGGVALTEGTDYRAEVNYSDGLSYGWNTITIYDLRRPTTQEGRDGISVEFELRRLFDLSECKPYDSLTYSYTGENIYLSNDVRIVTPDGEVKNLNVFNEVTREIYDSEGNRVTYPSKVGTYSMVLTANERQDDDYSEWFIGSVEFPLEVREGKDIAQYEWEYEIPELDEIFYHGQTIAIDIPTLSRTYADEVLKNGYDYTYRVLKNPGDSEGSAIDGYGRYYLEVTGINDCIGRFYREFYVLDPHSLSNAKVTSKPFVRVGDANLNPIESVTIDGVELQEGRDYAIDWNYSNENGDQSGSIGEMPTSIGYYAFGIQQIETEEGQNPVYYDYGGYGYYSIVPDDYAGEITQDCITINGVPASEFDYSAQYSVEGEFELDVDIAVNGVDLVEGRDFEANLVDWEGNQYDQPRVYQQNVVEIKDLRVPTVKRGSDAWRFCFDYYVITDLSKVQISGDMLNKEYTGRPIQFRTLETIDPATGRYNSWYYASDFDVVEYKNAEGKVVTPIDPGTYTCTVKGDKYNQALVGETTFTFEIKEGIDLSDGSLLIEFEGESDIAHVFYTLADGQLPQVKRVLDRTHNVELDLSRLSFEVVKYVEGKGYVPCDITGYGEYTVKVTGTGDYFNTGYYGITYANPQNIEYASVDYDVNNYLHTGDEVLEVSVSVNGVELVKDVDYTIEFDNGLTEPSMTPGWHNFIVKGTGTEESGYFGQNWNSYWVGYPSDISDMYIGSTLDLKYGDLAHNETQRTFHLYNSKEEMILLYPGEYEITYKDEGGNPVEKPTEVGTYTMTLTGVGPYSGSITKEFKVTDGNLNLGAYNYMISIPELEGLVYHDNDSLPVITHVYLPDGRELVAGTDFTYKFVESLWSDKEITSATTGAYRILLQGIGDCYGTACQYSDVIYYARDMAAAKVEAKESVRVGTGELNPVTSVVLDGNELTEGKDYKIEYYAKDNYGNMTVLLDSAPEKPGQYMARLVGLGEDSEGVFGYYGPIHYFVYGQNDIAGATVEVDRHIGVGENPITSVKMGDQTLTEGVDYEIECYRSDNYGDLTVRVDGMPTKVGTYMFRLKATGTESSGYYGYNGPMKVEVHAANDIALADVTYNEEVILGSGSLNPVTSVKMGDVELVEETDYVVTYFGKDKYGDYNVYLQGAPTNPGTYLARVIGTGNGESEYRGSYGPIHYKVVAEEIDYNSDFTQLQAQIDAAHAMFAKVYQGELYISDDGTDVNAADEWVPEPLAAQVRKALQEATDLNGKKWATQEMVDNATSVLDNALKTLEAAKANGKLCNVEFDSAGGSAIDKVQVLKGEKVARPDNPTLEGKLFGGWTLDGVEYDFDSAVEGDMVLTATWNDLYNIADAEFTWPDAMSSYKYDGVAKTPEPVVKANGAELVLGKDYTIEYADNVNAGTASAIVKGAGDYSPNSSLTMQFEIAKRSVTLTSESANKVYDGTPLVAPGVTVSGDGFLEGEVTDIRATGSQTTAGSSKNTIEYTTGEGFVADNYEITLKEGRLTIKTDPSQVGDTFSVDLDVKYGQTDARTMLQMVNDLRTGSDAWQLDENENKVYIKDLQPLTYDYQLERIAMQRAVETALHWDHVRPDGVTRSSDMFDGWTSTGENIAAGQSYSGTTSSIFEKWCETNEPYARQGHRRNMLSSGFTSIGIGHVTVNGTDYWVQVFGAPALDENETVANDSNETVEIQVSPDVVTSSIVESDTKLVTLHPGESADVPTIKAMLQTTETWPAEPVSVSIAGEWTSADESIASVANGVITANTAGSTTVSATVQLDEAKTVDVTVAVVPWSMSEATVTFPDDVMFTGEELRPNPTVKLGDKELAFMQDYTVEFASDNVNVGTAHATITGRGQYAGTVEGMFEIHPAKISAVAVKGGSLVYDGSAKQPELEVTTTNFVIAHQDDYDVTWSDNVEAGTAKAVVTGKGNFAGSAETTFTIDKAAVTGVDVADETLIYNGSEQKPGIVVKAGDLVVPEGSYGAAYAQNLNAGTALVKVEGTGNYTGSTQATFEIGQATITGVWIEGDQFPFEGAAVTPAVADVKAGDITLRAEDYDVAYVENDKPGTAKVVVTGKGNFKGVIETEFKIVPTATAAVEDATGAVTSVTAESMVLIEEADEQGTVELLVEETSADVAASYAEEVGADSESSEVFNVVDVKLVKVAENETVKEAAEDPNNIIEGTVSPIKLKFDVGSQYDGRTAIVYHFHEGDVVEADTKYQTVENGQVTVDITSLSDFGVMIAKEGFSPNISNGYVEWNEDVSSFVYDGVAKTPAYTVYGPDGSTLKEGVDYTAAFTNNLNAGPAKLTITGKGMYDPSTSIDAVFEISKAFVMLTSSSAKKAYDGKALTAPDVGIDGLGSNVFKSQVKDLKASGTVTGTKAKGGTAKNTIVYTTLDGFLESNYDIRKTEGTLTVTAIPQHKLTIKYVYADGKKVSDPYTKSYFEGDAYEVKIPAKTGYATTINKVNASTVKGTMGTKDVVVTVTYTATIPAGRGVSKPIRLWGNAALDTMSKIVDEGKFPTGGTVVISTDDGYWDALTAAGIAGLANAPVLMTNGYSLSSQTRAQIKKLKPKNIVICGGKLAVTEDVENQALAAAGAGANVIRCAGDTATGTAVKIFENGKKFGTWSNTAFICTNDGYWDALAAAPISYSKQMPIFLTEGYWSISNESLNAMKKGGIKYAYIVGGELAIDPHVQKQLEANGVKVLDRLWGNTAIETSEAVASFGTNTMKMTADYMGVATDDGYWDALAGAALCGRKGSVLVLVNGPKAHSISSFMSNAKDAISNFYIFGGEMAVSEATENAAVKASK